MPAPAQHTRQRLEDAALSLFRERGYHAVNVADIAVRAGLTRATYFRHFADKSEVLFWGQDELLDVMRRAIAEAPGSSTETDLVMAALTAAGLAFSPERHARAAARAAVIGSEPQLWWRLTAKRAAVSATLTAGLQARGASPTTAAAAGALGQLAFTAAHEQWAQEGPAVDVGPLACSLFSAYLAALHRMAPPSSTA